MSNQASEKPDAADQPSQADGATPAHSAPASAGDASPTPVRPSDRLPPRPRPAYPVQPPEPSPVPQRRSELPFHADEMAGFVLIGIGLLSFLALLSPDSGRLGAAWSGILRLLFGIGAFVISAAILAAGALLLAPKQGVRVQFSWWRLTSGEVLLVLLLAYIHAGIRASVSGEAGQIEAFAQATEGRGGGLVGWAIQDLFHMLLGDITAGAVLLILLLISAALTFGVRRQHVLNGLTWLQRQFLGLADRLQPGSVPASHRPDRPAQPPDSGTPPAGSGDPPDPVSDEGTANSHSRIVVHPSGRVELPPIPGRPSVVTGECGAGAVVVIRPESEIISQPPPGRDNQPPPATRIERLRARREGRSAGVEQRFKLEEVVDHKRLRRRPPKLPPLDLLDEIRFDRPSDEEINISAAIIEETVADFGMQVRVVGVKAGPTVTQYAVQPFKEVQQEDGTRIIQRVRVTRIASLASDLSLALAARSVRIQAPVPGTNYIGIEVSNAHPGIVSLRPVMESEQFFQIKGPLAIALGREVDGTPIAVDLSKMPHLLIGGTTGSGKSVCLRSIATCLIANNRPDQLRLVMIDPKMVELVRFNGLPHLLGRVEVQLDRIIGVLHWLTREMDRRYRVMEEAQARNIDVFNRGRHHKRRLPRIVVLIDELAELMTHYPDETEHLLTRLAQMARATGIHLVVATQRPSTDVVTGLIKANFPARIAFAVASSTDSRVILDAAGAEDLIGMGDMLYQSPEAAAPVRVQGCFVNDSEMARMVDYWCDHWDFNEDSEAPWEHALRRQALIEETDEMLEEAIRIVQQEGKASASLLQRRLNVGYPRAGRIIDLLYRLGVVGPEEAGGRNRSVLIKPDEDPID